MKLAIMEHVPVFQLDCIVQFKVATPLCAGAMPALAPFTVKLTDPTVNGLS